MCDTIDFSKAFTIQLISSNNQKSYYNWQILISKNILYFSSHSLKSNRTNSSEKFPNCLKESTKKQYGVWWTLRCLIQNILKSTIINLNPISNPNKSRSQNSQRTSTTNLRNNYSLYLIVRWPHCLVEAIGQPLWLSCDQTTSTHKPQTGSQTHVLSLGTSRQLCLLISWLWLEKRLFLGHASALAPCSCALRMRAEFKILSVAKNHSPHYTQYINQAEIKSP